MCVVPFFHEQGRDAVVRGLVDLGSQVAQQPRDRRVPILGGKEQGRGAVVLGLVDLGSLLPPTYLPLNLPPAKGE